MKQTKVEKVVKELLRQSGGRFELRYKSIGDKVSKDPDLKKFSLPELVLYIELIRMHFNPIHHARCGRYEMDIWLPQGQEPFRWGGLDIECDGAFWHDRPEMRTKDKRRDFDMAEQRVFTMRFDTGEILTDANLVACKIRRVWEIYMEADTKPSPGFLQMLVRKQWAERKNIGRTG